MKEKETIAGGRGSRGSGAVFLSALAFVSLQGCHEAPPHTAAPEEEPRVEATNSAGETMSRVVPAPLNTADPRPGDAAQPTISPVSALPSSEPYSETSTPPTGDREDLLGGDEELHAPSSEPSSAIEERGVDRPEIHGDSLVVAPSAATPETIAPPDGPKSAMTHGAQPVAPGEGAAATAGQDTEADRQIREGREHRPRSRELMEKRGATRGTRGSEVDRPRVRRPGLDDPVVPVPVVGMVLDAMEVAVGDSVVVRIQIAGGNDVGSVPFHVTYDPAVLRFESAEEGAFLSSDGRETAFFAAPTSPGDAIVVGLSRLGRGNGIAGGGDLCVLNFTAIGTGDAGLAFSRAKVRDSTNRIVSSSFERGSVRVR